MRSWYVKAMSRTDGEMVQSSVRNSVLGLGGGGGGNDCNNKRCSRTKNRRMAMYGD